MDFFLMLQEWCFKRNYTEESSSLRGPALISFLLWQNPEVNILDEEGPILAHSKRSFNPWSLDHVALGPVLRQSIMVRVQKSKAPPLRGARKQRGPGREGLYLQGHLPSCHQAPHPKSSTRGDDQVFTRPASGQGIRQGDRDGKHYRPTIRQII